MIYLDNAATTRLADGVAEYMARFHHDAFGNPSSSHRLGVDAARAIREAAEIFATALEATPGEVIFTSGGTESDNLAIRGAALAAPPRRRRGANVVCSAVEHPAVIDACRSLEDVEVETRIAPVDRFGRVDVSALLALVDERTLLVSVMHANNEVGTIQPLKALGAQLRALTPKPLFHVDAVQSFLKTPLNVHDMGIDLLSLSSHKLHGPKGVGALYVREGVLLRPLFFGGGQQRALRPGTQNVPGIVGFGEAVRLGRATLRTDIERMYALRKRLWCGIENRVPDISLNGHPEERLCNNLNVNFHGCQGETLLHHLEALGVSASAGSACHSKAGGPSPVLLAMGAREDRGSLRLSLSRTTTESEIDQAIAVLAAVVPEVRDLNLRS